MGSQALRGSLGSETNRPVIDDGTLIRTASFSQAPTTCDAQFFRRTEDVVRAWEMARSRYIRNAVKTHTTEDFYSALDALLPGLLTAIGLLATSTGIGAIAGGVFGAGVGAGPGAAAGFAFGLEFLNLLGLGFLAAYISERIGEVNQRFHSALSHAWNACGNEHALDHAAREFAEAIGIFCSLLMQAILAYASKEGLPAALARLNRTRLGRSFATWLQEGKWSTNVDVWLGKLSVTNAPLVRRGLKTALDFMRDRKFGPDNTRFSQMLEEKQLKRLQGIDFHKDVKVITLRAGDEIIQYQNTPGVTGNYFSKVGTSAENLGIDSTGRAFARYRLNSDVEVLESTAAEINYKIGDPSFRGRGIQYLIDNESRRHLQLLPRPSGPPATPTPKGP